MDDQSLWTLIHAAWRAILPAYEPLFERFAAERGLGTRGLGWLLAALTFEPESITPERLQVRGPYTAADAYLKELLTSYRVPNRTASPICSGGWYRPCWTRRHRRIRGCFVRVTASCLS